MFIWDLIYEAYRVCRDSHNVCSSHLVTFYSKLHAKQPSPEWLNLTGKNNYNRPNSPNLHLSKPCLSRLDLGVPTDKTCPLPFQQGDSFIYILDSTFFEALALDIRSLRLRLTFARYMARWASRNLFSDLCVIVCLPSIKKDQCYFVGSTYIRP